MSRSKNFFFDKKKQKTFERFGCGLSGMACMDLQTFFGTFVLKRTASFREPASTQGLAQGG
jgi:hypothetical protein